MYNVYFLCFLFIEIIIVNKILKIVIIKNKFVFILIVFYKYSYLIINVCNLILY